MTNTNMYQRASTASKQHPINILIIPKTPIINTVSLIYQNTMLDHTEEKVARHINV